MQADERILDDGAHGSAKLLRQLSLYAAVKERLLSKSEALSVLTNIEGSRLGTVGTGFRYLAQELADFPSR